MLGIVSLREISRRETTPAKIFSKNLGGLAMTIRNVKRVSHINHTPYAYLFKQKTKTHT
jgi:hypothetical protein